MHLGAAVGLTGLSGGDLGFATAFGGAGVSYSVSGGDVNNPPIGDRWMINIYNALPNAPVVQNGNTTPDATQCVGQIIGFTDQYGQFRRTGQFTAADLGSWSKNWSVGGRTVGSWVYKVRPPSDTNNLPPATLLRPMPSIIPVKPGQVSSAQVGPICQLSSWVSQNPVMAVLVAIGAGMVIRKL